MNTQARLRDVLSYRVETGPESPFLVFCDLEGHRESLTSAVFYRRVLRLANALHRLGLRAGDRCAIHLPNCVDFMLSFWALQELDAIAVPTIIHYSADELAYVTGHCEPWGVITDTEQLDKVSRVRRVQPSLRLVVSGAERSTEAAYALGELIDGGAADPVPAPKARPEEAMLLYTSGTTARPKGALLTHAGALYAAESLAHHLRLQPADRVLVCNPLFHVNGLYLGMLPTVVTGSVFVLAPRFSVSRYWGWVREGGVTVCHLVAGPVRLLLGAPPSPLDREHHVRLMTHGLPLADEEYAAFEERFGIKLYLGWSLTESGAGGTYMPLYFGRRPGYQAIGQALLGWNVRVADERGGEVPAGQVGELLVRGTGLMKGYYKDPEATAEALREGWLHTGDLGYADPEGYFYFVERKKDMIKPSGENVAASEVERVLLLHPGVEECAVIGVPDPIRHEAIKACVVVKPGAGLTPEDLIEFCAERLAKFKVPSMVEFRPELPKTSIGKIQKGVLRQEALSSTKGGGG